MKAPRSIESVLHSSSSQRGKRIFTPWVRSRGLQDPEYIRFRSELLKFHRRIIGDPAHLRSMIRTSMYGDQIRLDGSFSLIIPTILSCADYPDRIPGSAMLTLLMYEERRYDLTLATIPALDRLITAVEEGYILITEAIDSGKKTNPWKTIARRLPARMISRLKSVESSDLSLSQYSYRIEEAGDKPGFSVENESTQTVRMLVKRTYLTHWEVQHLLSSRQS